jgi:hypothetical protein
MIWFGIAWAIVYVLAIGAEAIEGMGFGNWPYGLVPFLALIPYFVVLRLLTLTKRDQRGPLLAGFIGLIASMILLILRYPAAIAVAQWWARIHGR